MYFNRCLIFWMLISTWYQHKACYHIKIYISDGSCCGVETSTSRDIGSNDCNVWQYVYVRDYKT